MGLLDRLTHRSHRLELDSASDPRGWLSRLDQTGSGVEVNEHTALNFLAVYASVSLLADSIAMLPAKVLRRDAEGSRPVPDHPALRLLGVECNTETSAMVGRQVIQAQALLGGCGYGEIERDKGNRPIGLYPIHWRRVTPRRHALTRELVYDVAPYLGNVEDGGVKQGALQGGTIPDLDMLRLPGLSLAGLRAVSPVAVAREVIGAGLAADRWLSSFFGNGAWPGGWIKTPKGFKTADDRAKYLESLNARHQGVARSFRIGLLEEGADFVAATIPAEEAQLLQLRVDLRREIARLYRVPPHLIGDLERATFSNIEEQGISFVVYSLLPWIIKWEQECARKLLSESERQTHFVKMTPAALLRGNTTARYEAYAKGIQAGFLSPDEARELEDLNPIPEGKGKVWLFPLNAALVGSGGDGGNGGTQPKRELWAPGAGAREKELSHERPAPPALRALSGLLQEELARALKGLAATVRREAEKAEKGAVLKRLMELSVWTRARQDAPRVLGGPLRAACRAVAFDLVGDGAAGEWAAGQAADLLTAAETELLVGEARAELEGAWVGARVGEDEGTVLLRALEKFEAAAAERVKPLMERIRAAVEGQIGGRDGSAQ